MAVMTVSRVLLFKGDDIMKGFYPAVFTKDEDAVLVDFPDIQGCYTDGKDMDEAYTMAEDAINGMLMYLEDEHEAIKPPSAIEDLEIPEGSFAVMFKVDTDKYRRMLNTKSVRKNISIPEWMDSMVKERNINLSNFVQNALKTEFAN